MKNSIERSLRRLLPSKVTYSKPFKIVNEMKNSIERSLRRLLPSKVTYSKPFKIVNEMKNSIKKLDVRQEWLACIALTALACALTACDTSAVPAEDQLLKAIGDKLRNLILLSLNTVAIVVAVVMIAIKVLGYAMKDSAERSEEDARKLKAGIIRVAVGTGLAMGAGSIGTFIVSAL
jgi:hypothetical protein